MHDRNGTPVKVGDLVLIPAKVVEVQAHETFCNAGVELLPMRGTERVDRWTLNTGQFVVHDRPSLPN